MIPTLEWLPTGVNFLDQTKLPLEETYVLATDYNQVATVIRDMIVRGAPAIGVSAAMGVALGVSQSSATDIPTLNEEVAVIAKTLAETRPTAVNLFWAIERMRDKYNALAAAGTSIPEIKATLIKEAQLMYDEDIAACKSMGAHGAALLPNEGTVLTHCNAGALATCGYGTALGVIRAAVERGHKIDVYADETRPYLQGARLTAWELIHDNIPTTVLCDNMAGSLMRQGKIQAVIVGADRIAANGDTANKIGTYQLAIAARHHGVKFMVVAPSTTVDMATADGDDIEIELREATELLSMSGTRTVVEGAEAWNPVFDVTPAALIDALVTERGVIEHPDFSKMQAVFGG
jgi:methylthioribose-1-phosphate isomerase